MLKYNPTARIQKILNNKLPTLPPSPTLGVRAVDWLLERAILGHPMPFNARTKNGKLSAHQVTTVRSLGIKVHHGQFYHQGLINAATKTEKPLDTVRIYTHVLKNLIFVSSAPDSELAADTQALLMGLDLCYRAQLSLLNESNGIVSLLAKEHQLQMAQLGCLVLPQTLLTQLREPVHFVDTTAKAFGRFAEVVLRTGKLPCSSPKNTHTPQEAGMNPTGFVK